jgi:sulfopyruvate decarboxylase subunit alpha
MVDGPRLIRLLADEGVTDIVWLPDSTLGSWEEAILSEPRLRLTRVCREGEAWGIAAGLWIGGRTPVVVIQNTGFFESGDALRNVLYDLGLPIFSLVGYRSYLLSGSRDTARRFTEPLVSAWDLEPVLVVSDDDLPRVAAHYRRAISEHRHAVVLIAEGPG